MDPGDDARNSVAQIGRFGGQPHSVHFVSDNKETITVPSAIWNLFISYNLTSVLEDIPNLQNSPSEIVTSVANSNIPWHNLSHISVWNNHEDLPYFKRLNRQIPASYRTHEILDNPKLLQRFAFLSTVQFHLSPSSIYLELGMKVLSQYEQRLSYAILANNQRYILQTDASCRISISNTASSSPAGVTVFSGSSTSSESWACCSTKFSTSSFFLIPLILSEAAKNLLDQGCETFSECWLHWKIQRSLRDNFSFETEWCVLAVIANSRSIKQNKINYSDLFKLITNVLYIYN